MDVFYYIINCNKRWFLRTWIILKTLSFTWLTIFPHSFYTDIFLIKEKLSFTVSLIVFNLSLIFIAAWPNYQALSMSFGVNNISFIIKVIIREDDPLASFFRVIFPLSINIVFILKSI